jgi:tRNA pseudouridine55 synthase
LARTRAGSFTVDDAVPLDTLREAANDGLEAVQRLLRPVDAGLERLPAADIAETDVPRLAAGLPVRPVTPVDEATSSAPVVRIRVVDGPIVAIGHVDGGRLAPDKVLVDRWIGTEGPASPAEAEANETTGAGATPG